MKLLSDVSAAKRHLRELREKRKEKIRNELRQYGNEVLNSEEMQLAFSQTHHTRSTVGEHTRRVAEKSLALCHALEKLHIKTDIPSVVTGSLCHDLGILGRDKKYGSDRECYRQHPADSTEVARRLLKDLPKKTQDIIEHHMWPTAGSKAPASLEGVIVSAADKVAAIEDFIRGSKTKPVGLKETIKNIRERSKRRGS